MVRYGEISELQDFLERINDVKLSKILGLSYFSAAYSDHLNKSKIFNLEEIALKYKEIGIKEKDIVTLCRICDFLNRDLNGYIPIIKNQVFNISYDYISDYDNRFVNHKIIIQSNFIDLEKVVSILFADVLVYEKLNNAEILLNRCNSLSIEEIQKEVVKNYITSEPKSISFVGPEDELDKLIELFESVTKDFSYLAESYYLTNAINLIISLIPNDIKNAKTCNFISKIKQIPALEKKRLLQFVEDSRITKISQLNKIKYQDVNVEYLRLIAVVLHNSDYYSPKTIQDYVISTLKEKEQMYAQLRFEKGLRYNEIGLEVGISRAGAQAALVNIVKRLHTVGRYRHLHEMMNQVLLFRDNDYFISSELFDRLGIWKGLIIEIFNLQEYKNSGLYIIDGFFDYNDEIEDDIDEDDEEKEELSEDTEIVEDEREYEFDFIKTLPSVIKKKELNKYIDIVVENSKKMINKNDVKRIIELNYRDYNSVISKTKLNISYFMKQILQTYFPDGLDVYNKENLNKIRNLLLELYNYSIEEYNDRYITHRICMVSTLIGRGIWKYNPEQIEIPKELSDKINNYIETYPISAVPFRSVYDEFADDLLEIGIENKYALQGVLKTIIKPEFKATKDYVYTDDSQTYVEIIAQFIKNSKELVTKELLEKQFPGFSITSMQRVINTSSVVNMNGYFASMDNFNFTQEEISSLKFELEQIVQDGEAHNTKNIFYKFKNKFNGLFNRIGINHYLQFYYIINKLFDDDFEFLRPFIAKKGVEIQDKETQLIELIVEEGKISVDRLRELTTQVGYFMESIMDLVIRNNDEIVFLDEETIVAVNKIEIDEEKMAHIDTILDRFMLYSDYRYLAELANYNEIRDMFSFANKWFLYSIVSAYSTKYKIFRTNNVMSRTELVIAKEDFDIRELENLSAAPEVFDLDDLLDIEDLE